jgi:hypothetical protein
VFWQLDLLKGADRLPLLRNRAAKLGFSSLLTLQNKPLRRNSNKVSVFGDSLSAILIALASFAVLCLHLEIFTERMPHASVLLREVS